MVADGTGHLALALLGWCAEDGGPLRTGVAAMAGRCLIVGNQTLGGTTLDVAVARLVCEGIAAFHVLVPATQVGDQATAWGGGFVVADDIAPMVMASSNVAALEEHARRSEAQAEEGRVRAQERLDLMVEHLSAMGVAATGEVGTEDPYEAAKQVVERLEPFDAVIVSTLPGGISRWLRLDLPRRIQRLVDVPVVSVEAEPLP